MTNGEQLLKDAKEMTVEGFGKKYQYIINLNCGVCSTQDSPIEECKGETVCAEQVYYWLNANVPKEYPLSFMELFDFVDGTLFQRAGEESKVYVLFNGWFFRRLKDESRVPVTVSREIVSDKYRVISHSELPSK